MRTPLVLHTCDDRSWLLPYWIYTFNKHVKFNNTKLICSGSECWSDRLIRILIDIYSMGHRTIFYTQEDFWPVLDFTAKQYSELLYRFKSEHLNAIHICKTSDKYIIEDGYLHPKSPYLMNHQPGIWNIEFLLNCLKPGESPWQNEIDGTKRLHKMNLERKIGIEIWDWYVHACRKGVLTEEGKCLKEKIDREISSQNS